MRTHRSHAPRRAGAVLAVLAVVTAALWASGMAAAQNPPSPTVPSTPPVPVPVVPPPPQAPPTPPAPPDGPPSLSSLKVPKVVTAQQGHARFLLGVRLSHQARVRVQITRNRMPVRTVVTDPHPPGRVYLLIEATNERRFQLPAGTYAVAVSATDDRGRSSRTLNASFRLRLTAPRGRLDAYTVPMWPSLARTLRKPAGGVLVTALGPRGAAVRAGLRRGDVITALNGRRLTGPGALMTVLRALPAQKAVPVEVLRDGQPLTLQLTPDPDWQPAPNYEAALRVIVQREPNVLAYAFARARNLVESGRADDAEDLIDDWRPAWKRTALYHLLQGEILSAKGEHKRALGAFNRAQRADRAMPAARFGRGLALAALDRDRESLSAFTAAVAADPTDAAAQAFRAYLLIQNDRFPQALEAANRAIALDRNYEAGHIARGLALIAAGRTADGVAALKRGLVLLADPQRAAQLISERLEPNEP